MRPRRSRSVIRSALLLLVAWLPLRPALSGQAPLQHRAAELLDLAAPHPVAAVLSFPDPAPVRSGAADTARPRRRGSVVLVVPDRLGPDPRWEPYITQLLGAGIAVVELLADDAASAFAALDPAARAAAGHPRIDPARLGVLGFGSGGIAAAAASAPFRARALLYPGCPALLRLLPDLEGAADAWRGSAMLLLHGGADEANPGQACAAYVTAIRRHDIATRRISYPGASYAWDLPGFRRDGGRSFQFVPDGGSHAGRRVEAVPWPDLAALSATQVAAFFASALAAPAEP